MYGVMLNLCITNLSVVASIFVNNVLVFLRDTFANIFLQCDSLNVSTANVSPQAASVVSSVKCIQVALQY